MFVGKVAARRRRCSWLVGVVGWPGGGGGGVFVAGVGYGRPVRSAQFCCSYDR